MLVERLMTRDVEACRPESLLSEAAAIMWRRDCGVVPVVDAERHVVGVVTDRDICIALATRPRVASEVRVGEVMSRPVHTCTEVDDLSEALELMRRERVRRLPVLDGGDKLAGILSLNDVILHSDRGKSKKHVSHRETMLTLKAVSTPHDARADATTETPSETEPASEAATYVSEDEPERPKKERTKKGGRASERDEAREKKKGKTKAEPKGKTKEKPKGKTEGAPTDDEGAVVDDVVAGL